MTGLENVPAKAVEASAVDSARVDATPNLMVRILTWHLN